MFLTKKHLSRRTVLKAAGVSLSLPLLDAMIPAYTALAQTAAAPKLRAGFFYIPHGAIMWNTPYGKDVDAWTPSGAGADFKLSPILSPLENYKRYVASFGNLENKAPQGSVHTIVPATWLSGVKPDQKATGARMAPTIDQMIAEKIGGDSVLPSLEVSSRDDDAERGLRLGRVLLQLDAVVPQRDDAAADGVQPAQGVHAALRRRRHARGARDPRAAPRERARHDRRAHGRPASASSAPPTSACSTTTSRACARRSGASRRRRSAISPRIDLPDTPIGELPDFDEQVKLMFDLIHLAYQANVTRVASYIMVAEGTNRTYNHIGVSDAFHPLSHHANNKDRIDKLVRVQTYHVQRFADFVDKLAKTPDGEGSLLDHSLLMYGSNMSNSDRHNNYPLPNILVGGANGAAARAASTLTLPEYTTFSNLLLTVVNKAGLEMKSIGDSTGEIAGV